MNIHPEWAEHHVRRARDSRGTRCNDSVTHHHATARTLTRQSLAELVGTAALVAVVVGSGISAQRLAADPGLQLLINALATVGGLAVVILVVGPVSGAHLNPVISLADWWLGRRSGSGLGAGALAAYVVAQVGGGFAGTVLAHAMHDEAFVDWSSHTRSGPGLLLSEGIATAGLVLVVIAMARLGSPALTAWTVASYIGAAYFFTSSTSFANPAVTIARTATETFAGIAPSSAPAFVAVQLLGGAVGLALALGLYPDADETADDVVIHVDQPAEETR